VNNELDICLQEEAKSQKSSVGIVELKFQLAA
jgi:hypothetical protein